VISPDLCISKSMITSQIKGSSCPLYKSSSTCAEIKRQRGLTGDIDLLFVVAVIFVSLRMGSQSARV